LHYPCLPRWFRGLASVSLARRESSSAISLIMFGVIPSSFFVSYTAPQAGRTADRRLIDAEAFGNVDGGKSEIIVSEMAEQAPGKNALGRFVA